MSTGGHREAIDAKIAAWERELERLRVALANAPDAVNARHHAGFVELYRQKEVVKSRWEVIRGVYRPKADDVHRFEDALAAMDAAWTAAQPMLVEVLAGASS
jgi:putative heme degradation protein